MQGLSWAQRNTSFISSIFIRTERPRKNKFTFSCIFSIEQESLTNLVDRVPRSCPKTAVLHRRKKLVSLLAIDNSYDRSVIILAVPYVMIEIR